MSERTTVRLPQDLLNHAKRKAAAEGRTLTSLIEEGLRIVVAERGNGSRKRAVRFASARPRGGPMPGIDITKFSALEELDDLEYVERMKHFK